MLAIIIGLVVLWAVGFFAFHTLGWVIHVLLVIAVIMILVRLIQGKNPFK